MSRYGAVRGKSWHQSNTCRASNSLCCFQHHSLISLMKKLHIKALGEKSISARLFIFRYSLWDPPTSWHFITLTVNQDYSDQLITHEDLWSRERIHQFMLLRSPQECLWRGTEFFEELCSPGALSWALAPSLQDKVFALIEHHFPAEEKRSLTPPFSPSFRLSCECLLF